MPVIHRFEFASPAVAPSPPGRFTWPFCYEPHPLVIAAMTAIEGYINSLRDDPTERRWLAELDAGKMLGALVVRDRSGALAFLAAFSGTIAGSYRHPYFVPPLLDLMEPGGFYLTGMERIDDINSDIEARQRSDALTGLERDLAAAEQRADSLIAAAKRESDRERSERHVLRRGGNLTAEQQAALIARSQFQNAELKRLRRTVAQEVEQARQVLAGEREAIERLKRERAALSAALQHAIFTSMRVSNAAGETTTVLDAVARYQRDAGMPVTPPPGGTGECCAPKLLQYAYDHGLQPLCMGEMWWGREHEGELRRHGSWYPSCNSKCKPLLHFMLQGLEVDPDPMNRRCEVPLRVLHDDRWLSVVSKPAGMLSQPGKLVNAVTVEQAYRDAVADAGEAMVAHRLDMDTSGLMVIAKTAAVHKALQQLFANGGVAKHYTAIVAGEVSADSGVIDLPLAPCLDDRPRQQVDIEHGKRAVTRYTVLERTPRGTRVDLEPLTGRTHQLRVHAAHRAGLAAPIVGDRLYGTAAGRLMLHATTIAFAHPITGEALTITDPPPF